MSLKNASVLKEKIRKGHVTVGSWMSLGHAGIAEIMADAGFDWLVIDLEHSVVSLREAEESIRILDLKGVSPLVRLTSNQPDQIKRVMDAGAHGIVVPMVNSAQQAEMAVKAVRYPPKGIRGVGLARAQRYGAGFEEYAQCVNECAVVIAQIEHVLAIEHLEEILAVEGIDGSMIGPYDLSGSMGKPGKYYDADVQRAMQHYLEVSKAMNKPAGTHVIPVDPKLVKDKIQQGYQFIAFSTDFLFLGESCRSNIKMLREHMSEMKK